MIVLLAAALACVPLSQADAFGDLSFPEGGPGDSRLVAIVCSDGLEGECEARDRQGIRYAFLDGGMMSKVVDGPGPSGQFVDQLEPSPHRSDELWAGLCDLEFSWVSLRTGADGKQIYGLYTQP